MKVSVVRGGGVAGITTRTGLSSDALSPDAAQAFAERVERVELLSRSRESGVQPAERHPDELAYSVSIDHDGDVQTLRYTESTLPEELRSLIGWIDERPEREHRVQGPGAQL